MRIESAQRSYQSSLVLPYTNEEVIQTFLHINKTSLLNEYPTLISDCWVNGYLEEGFITSVIKSLPELPFPNFTDTDSQASRMVKAIDAEWLSPSVYLCFWINNNTTPTVGATTNSPGNWVYIGKISVLNQYGYPERKYRYYDFLTDNITRKLAEGVRLGVSYQWTEKMFYHTLSNVTYTTDPNNGVPISTFTELLPETTLSYAIGGFRVISGEEIPMQPIIALEGRNLIVVFDYEVPISPNVIKAIVREVGSTQKLNVSDYVSLDCCYTVEVISLQPDYTPNPIIVQGTVLTTTRNKDTRTFNASTTRQTALNAQVTRESGSIVNSGVNNVVYFKYGSDVSVAGGLIPTGTDPNSVSGGYTGTLAVNGGTHTVVTGYNGVITVITQAGVSSITTTDTYKVSG